MGPRNPATPAKQRNLQLGWPMKEKHMAKIGGCSPVRLAGGVELEL